MVSPSAVSQPPEEVGPTGTPSAQLLAVHLPSCQLASACVCQQPKSLPHLPVPVMGSGITPGTNETGSQFLQRA